MHTGYRLRLGMTNTAYCYVMLCYALVKLTVTQLVQKYEGPNTRSHPELDKSNKTHFNIIS
jgi:hypothetical protein